MASKGLSKRFQTNPLRHDKTRETVDDYAFVAAIDLGTAFSGYAYSSKNNPTNVRWNKNWGAEYGCSSFKTPTCVLFDGDGEFKSFGYDAQREQLMLPRYESINFYYFDRFKMLLPENPVGQIIF